MAETDSANLELKRHALEYWNADGVPTIFKAAAYLLYGGLFAALICAVAVIRDAELAWVVFFLGLPATAFVLVWFIYRSEDFIESLKEWLTYPRTGYAAPPSQWKRSEREDAFDASFGRFSGVARFLRCRWVLFYFLFYCAWYLFRFMNDTLSHPFHPSQDSRAAFLIVLGFVGALVRIPRLLRDKLVAIEVLGYPVLGFLAANALRKQQLLPFFLLVGFTPPFLVLTRGVLKFVNYIRKNPMPSA